MTDGMDLAVQDQNMPGQYAPVPTFHGSTYDDHVSAGQMLVRNVQQNLWALAAVCASVESKYGRVAEFARDIGVSRTYVDQLAKTYRTYQSQKRFEGLSFTHHLVATRSPNPARALEAAEKQGLKVQKFKNYVREERIKNGTYEVRSTGRPRKKPDPNKTPCPHCNGTGWIPKGDNE